MSSRVNSMSEFVRKISHVNIGTSVNMKPPATVTRRVRRLIRIHSKSKGTSKGTTASILRDDLLRGNIGRRNSRDRCIEKRGLGGVNDSNVGRRNSSRKAIVVKIKGTLKQAAKRDVRA